MQPTHRRRLSAIALTALLAIGIATASSGCDPVSRSWAWRAGRTHGAIVETTAGRASLAIYRVPTNLLYQAQAKHGVGAVQALLWHFGKPPELKKSFRFQGRSVTLQFGTGTRALRSLTHRLIHDDPGDLRSALVDAHRNRSCLALTLVSYGKPASNWTHKQVGCLNGGI